MNDTICHYREDKYKIVGILHSLSAVISFLASLLVITIIILFKKLRFFPQRLILYLSLAAAIYSIVTASVKTDYKTINEVTETYCKWIGFASQYTQWMLLLAVCVMTVDIFLRVLSTRQNDPSPYLEIVYVLNIFLMPALFNWLPFIWDMYGISGDWCWIKNRTMNNKTGKCDSNIRLGTGLQFGLWYGPLMIACCVITTSYMLIMIQLRKQRRQVAIYNPEEIQRLRNMRNEIKSIFWYPVVFMVINLFPLTNRIISSFTEPVFPLWVLHALISPLQGGFMALIYGLDSDTRRSLNKQALKAAIFDFCQKNEVITEYKIGGGRERGYISEKASLLSKPS